MQAISSYIGGTVPLGCTVVPLGVKAKNLIRHNCFLKPMQLMFNLKLNRVVPIIM